MPSRDPPTAEPSDDRHATHHDQETETPMHENAHHHDRNEPPGLVGTVVRYEDAPDEYTVHPPDATEGELVTTWLTAREGAFVDLTEMR